MEKEVRIIDLINSYVNNCFIEGNNIKQVKNYKGLILFMNENNIPFELDAQDYEQLLKNEKIIDMMKSLLESKNNKTYLENPMFYSLALLYSNENGIKIDFEDEEEIEEQELIEDKKYKKEKYQDEADYIAKTSSVNAYFKNLVYPPYTAEEAHDIYKRYFEGEKSLRDDIVKHNLRLVVSIAKRYVGRGATFDDLIQEGNTGLLIAVDKYDYRIGNKFSTYASFWIKQSIIRNMSDNSRIIRIPPHLDAIIFKMDQFKKKYFQENKGEEPSIQEIAEGIGVEYEKVKMVSDIMTPVSLNTPVGDGDIKDSELGDFVSDDKALDVDERLFLEEFYNAVFNTDVLKQREKEVIAYRFGFINGRRYRLEEVGKIYNLTRERIRQIELKALRKLRHSKLIKEFNPSYEEETKIKFLM